MKDNTIQRSADFAQMLANGAAIVEGVEVDALRLAEKMKRIHGGSWLSHVDHATGFILIRVDGREVDD